MAPAHMGKLIMSGIAVMLLLIMASGSAAASAFTKHVESVHSQTRLLPERGPATEVIRGAGSRFPITTQNQNGTTA